MNWFNKMLSKKFSVRIVYSFKSRRGDCFNVEWAYYRLFPLYEPIKYYGNIGKEYIITPFYLSDAEIFAKNLTIERVIEIKKENKLAEQKYLKKLKEEELELKNYYKVRYIK